MKVIIKAHDNGSIDVIYKDKDVWLVIEHDNNTEEIYANDDLINET